MTVSQKTGSQRMPNREWSDERLMQSYQMGEYEAFQELYRRYASKLYGYLRQRIKEHAAVDDVFQMTWAKLHRARKAYDVSYPFAPWLFTICRNAMLDQVRQVQREGVRVELSQAEIPVAVSESVSSPMSGVLETAAALPAQQRVALEMRFVQEASFEEIARRLETSPANARQMISRAVRKLKSLLEKGEKT